MADPTLGRALLALARGAIEMRFGRSEPIIADDARLHAPGATFVTLMQHDALRGCIGTLEAMRPLHDDVRRPARGDAVVHRLPRGRE